MLANVFRCGSRSLGRIRIDRYGPCGDVGSTGIRAPLVCCSATCSLIANKEPILPSHGQLVLPWVCHCRLLGHHVTISIASRCAGAALSGCCKATNSQKMPSRHQSHLWEAGYHLGRWQLWLVVAGSKSSESMPPLSISTVPCLPRGVDVLYDVIRSHSCHLARSVATILVRSRPQLRHSIRMRGTHLNSFACSRFVPGWRYPLR